ncbi:MAG TPA: hypothetical protein VK009_14070 [Chloroflexota bacterium]|nr:hypothetical protein [Chloroflexota bacterium]
MRLEATYRLPWRVLLPQGALTPIQLKERPWVITLEEPHWEGEPVGGSSPPRHANTIKVTADGGAPAGAANEAFPVVEPVLRSVLTRLLALLRAERVMPWPQGQSNPFAWTRYPLQYTYFDDFGNVVPEGSGGTGLAAIDPFFWLTDDKWKRIGKALQSHEEPSLPTLLLGEADEFHVNGEIRSTVLACAMACEIAMKTFVRKAGGARDPVFEYIVDKDRELSVFDYLDDLLNLILGVKPKEILKIDMGSLKADYTDLRRLFEARNKVAHEGRAYYRNSGGNAVDVDDAILGRFVVIARALVSWLEEEARQRKFSL